mgnify:FL=1
MIKRKWYERVSAAALAAMLFMNSGGMGVQSRAEILSGENGVVIQEAEGEAQPEANEEEQGLQEEKLENNGENGENDPEEENPEEESAQEEPSEEESLEETENGESSGEESPTEESAADEGDGEGEENASESSEEMTEPETEPETMPETVPETVPETIPETIPETTTAATSQQSVTWMITGFEPLKDEIMAQQLPLGSVETDIQFPDTLEVTMQKVRDAEDDVENDAADLEQNESAQESTEFAENDTIQEMNQKLSGVTWQLDSELSVYPEFHGGISQKEYFTEFDEDGNPIETEEKTYAGYAKENEPYSGAVYIYHAVLPEEDSNGKPIELADGVEIPEIYVVLGEAGGALYAVEEATYTVSGSAEAFTVNGGGINRTFTGSEAVDDAFNAIIGNSVNGKATIHFDNVNITQDNAFPIITQSCELTLTGSYTNLNYAFEFSGDGPFMIHSSANIKANILLDRSGNGQLTFEQTGGTITVGEHGAVLLSDNDTYTLANGTIKGAIGGSGEFVMDNGTLNGYINGPKSITINGGNINTTFGPGAYVYSIYLKEDSELDINGGAIYAKNNSTKDEGGSAFAIITEKNDRITLKKNVNITAEAYSSSMPSASIWYYDSEDQNVIDATGVTEFTHPLTIAARSTAMKNISPFANWIEGTTANITKIKENTRLKVFLDMCGSNVEDPQYQNYEPLVSGNYIRMQDKNNQLPDIVSGDISYIVVGPYDNYHYQYNYTVDNQPDPKVGVIDTRQISLNNLIAALLAADTGYGCELSVQTIENLTAVDITVDTTGTCITLRGTITGRVNVIGTGKLISKISAAGMDGNTASTIEIRGGKIVSPAGSTESAISLSNANLKVCDGAVITDNSTSNASGIYAINASGPVTVEIAGGTITSANHTAVNLFMQGQGSDYASLIMSGGQISGNIYGIKQFSSGSTSFTGGSVSGGSADIFFEGDTRNKGQFVVEGEIPFDTVEIAATSYMSRVHMDLIKASFDTGKSLQVKLPTSNISDTTNINLFSVSKSDYRNMMDHISLTANGYAPIKVVNNATKDGETADIYAFWRASATGMYRLVQYFSSNDQQMPDYQEYLLKGSFLSNVDLNLENLAGWKKANGTRIADDYQINAENLKLYPAYKVTLTANIADEDRTENSAVIKGTTDGTTVYCVDSTRYESGGSSMTAAEIVAAGENNDSYVTKATVGADGSYSLSVTGLFSYTDYTYYLATQNTNGDYSEIIPVRFRTLPKTPTADDFQIAQTTFTYNGQTIAERGITMVSPKIPNSLEIGKTYYRRKNADGYAAEEIESPVNAGIYGVFIKAAPIDPRFGYAINLLVGDITIEKANLDSYWFYLPVDSITYGEDDSDDRIRPKLIPSMSRISGYGNLEFKLYNLSNLTEEVSRNQEGHYDATPSTDVSRDTKTVGITCTGGENINPQNTPIPVGNYKQINFYRGTNRISLACDSITYGQTPNLEVTALDTSYGVSYTYSQNRDDVASYGAWNTENPVGTWYVKAKTAKTLNYNEAESGPVEFQVTKGTLVPVVKSIESKTYDGNTNATGILGLIAAEGSAIPAGDRAAVNAEDAVSGTFSWTSSAAGTNTVDVADIKLSSSLASKYELSTDQLSSESFGGAKILPAKVDENDFTVSGYSGVYDGESHGIGRFIWGSTNYEITFKDKDGNYTLTSSEWPEYTNVGDYLVEYRLTNENYEPYYGSEQIHISPAPLTVTAEDKTVTYKEEAPVYSYVATGFVHGEDESVLEEIANYDCVYTAGSDVGEYEIMPYGFAAKNGNYDISYQPGKLTVEQAEPEFYLTNLEELNRVYDAKAIVPKAGSDSDGKLTITISKGMEIFHTSPVDAGIYTVMISGEAGKNYKAGSAAYSFEIRKAPLTVTAVDQRIALGSEIPEYMADYKGFQGTDEERVLGGALQFVCEYTANSPIGEYAIVPSGLTSDNYEIQFVNGTLYVNLKNSHISSGSGSSGSSGDSGSEITSSGGTWDKQEKGWRFYYKNGSYAAGKRTKDADGTIYENLKWVKINGNWWPFGADGYLKTGWVLDGADNRWYQIDENTGMRKGWYFGQNDDKNWYYLDSVSGAMVTGWQFINGKWYYFSVTSATPLWRYDLTTGRWIFDPKSNGRPYGAMYQNTQTPDGYYVDENGAWDGREAKIR